ncbi:hypothetical protein FRC03_006706 [Tulasnella sp. 419]|nr:hypothetical protein FRC02_007863 [Tulasnella sp. 418]KAG8970577.1 hypothetical protein FRC03_006706 [Tulasnella sp. 419]
MASASSSKEPSKNTKSAPNLEDLEKLLAREETALERDLEESVERILKAFKLNPYDILAITPDASADDVKKRYRHLSLYIHPDKATHPRASEAFDLLKKAESELSDKEKRGDLDQLYVQARSLVLKSLSLPTAIEDDDPRLKALQPGFRESLLKQVKDILIDEEVRRRKAYKLNLANEGLEAKKKEEEVANKKRKAEEDKLWEENRDQRVDSWRSFTAGKKKKKAKVNVLG